MYHGKFVQQMLNVTQGRPLYCKLCSNVVITIKFILRVIVCLQDCLTVLLAKLKKVVVNIPGLTSIVQIIVSWLSFETSSVASLFS